MLQVSQSKITRDDVLADPHNMMARWVEQELRLRKLPLIQGCALAVKEFGGNHPCSDNMIRKMKSMEKFKYVTKQHKKTEKVSVDPVHEVMISVGRKY